MTQLILNIEDTTILPSLKKILGAISGVSIAKSQPRRKKEWSAARARNMSWNLP